MMKSAADMMKNMSPDDLANLAKMAPGMGQN